MTLRMALRKTQILVIVAAIIPHIAFAEIPVTVQELGETLVAREFRAPASVITANRAVVTSQITALIEEITVDVGDEVEKEQLLVKLDQSDTRLALAEAEAALAALDAQLLDARQRLQRAEDLLERSFVSEDELDVRRTELSVIEANRERQLVAIQDARLALARTKVRAPFEAAVVQRQGQVGNLATPGTPLLTLVQTAGREVDAEVDPRYAGQLQQASDLRFVSNGQAWPVELARLSAVIETDTRKVRGRFHFPDAVAPIGATGEVVWREPSSMVPVSLIVQRGSELGIFVASAGRARFVAIPTAQEGRPAEVDLPVDTPIVTRGHVRLQDGDAVQITRE
jgi:membrane fusion protein, multidrug efflux system